MIINKYDLNQKNYNNMKKSMLFVMLFSILCTFALTSCGKKEEEKKKTRVHTFATEMYGYTNTYTYNYGSDGKITKVTRLEEGEGNTYNTTYNFHYSGDTIRITRIEHPSTEEGAYYTIILGSNGYAASFADEWDLWTYTYNSDNYLVRVDRNGNLRSEITVTNGNIETWTRSQNDEWQTKTQTYFGDENKGGCNTVYSEGAVPARWVVETGLFGKACKNLCQTSKWNHSDVTANYTYVKDNNDYVTTETKDYSGDLELARYTWEEVAE
jgi:hypothetical protein